MASMQEIDPNDIRAVQYLDTVTPGKLSGVKLFMKNGNVHLFQNEDLPLALALAKDRFPKQEGSTRMSDQPLEEPERTFVETIRSFGETKPLNSLDDKTAGYWHGGE